MKQKLLNSWSTKYGFKCRRAVKASENFQSIFIKLKILCSSYNIINMLLLVTWQCSFNPVYCSPETASAYVDNNSSHIKVQLGGVMHLFPRYGYLSLSMRVVPRNDSLSWIFLEPTKDVFEVSTIKAEERSFTSSGSSLPLHNEFHIDLCEDIQQLVQSYFRRFVIQGLEKPWRAFAGGWRSPSLSKYFGIDPSFVVGDYRYMLVRVLMVQNSGKVTLLPNVTLAPEYMSHIQTFEPQNYISSYKFFNEIGTHYVSSYITGNSIYQVFVYDAQGFNAIKLRLSETGWSKESYMSQLPGLLPLWVKHIGKVFVLNSNAGVTENVRSALMSTSVPETPMIFKMHDNNALVRKIEGHLKHQPGGLLGIELKTLDLLFQDPLKRMWLVESLRHTMQLWEINLN